MSTCRSCGALIVWALTEGGKRMPVDTQADPEGSLALWRAEGEWRTKVIQSDWHGPRYRPHFATCPDAESWRRPR